MESIARIPLSRGLESVHPAVKYLSFTSGARLYRCLLTKVEVN
jgi:hypothetical protein